MKLLLIDDDINLCRVLSHQLKKKGYQVTIANAGREGLDKFKADDFEIVITDIQMPDISGIEVLERIRKTNQQAVIIIITAYGSVENAIEACRMGADDYITKPFSQEQLHFVIEKAVRLRKLQGENIRLRRELKDRYDFGNMVAESPAMKALLETAKKVSDSDATVLIRGESGTGKELLARAIHFNSPRRDKPLITVNCPSIPDNLMESELFGHVKGAFTGAVRDRKGKFEMADGGTIFLDEIGDLKLDVQAKLLRVLQEQEIERLGESKTIKVDVRVIAATNKDLAKMMKEDLFREDLFYRLEVVPLNIQPLRNRKEDIPYLIDYFIQRMRPGEEIEIENEVYDKLKAYNWPGNVRELENTIERMLVLSENSRITADNLPPHIKARQPVFGEEEEQDNAASDADLTLEEVERQAILRAIHKSNGNQSKAAKLLGIPRHVLLYRMKKYGVTV
jgi:DNA-binding NtrC family response regulator